MFARFRFSVVFPAILLLSAAGIANAMAKQCDADEIHWTITGQRSVTFDWRGTAPGIQFGTTAAYGHTVNGAPPSPMPFSSLGPFHEAPLNDLKPNTVYHYSIGSCPDHTFKTAPLPGTANFTIDAEGDMGASIDYKDIVPNQEMIAAHMPAVMLVLGDLTYAHPNGQAAVDQHFNDVMVWSQEAASMPSWGNHEWDTPSQDNLKNYKGRFQLPHSQASPGAPALGCCGEDWYWFDYGNARFISYPSRYTSKTWPDWRQKAGKIMDQAQRDPKIDFIVTFGHRAPYTSGHHESDLDLRHDIFELAKAHSKYVLSVNGHSHDYERSHPEHGVVFVTAGTGGSKLEESKTVCLFRLCPEPSWSAFRVMHFGVLQLHFTKSEIQGSFLCGPAGGGKNDITCKPGEVIDHFTVQRGDK